MKQHFLPAIRLTVISIVVFMVLYPLLIWAIAQAAPNHGKGETVTVNNRVAGYKLIGQSFTNDNYFNSRPSAVGYNAAGSGGSNKGPSNPDYLKQVQDRIDTFLTHNPSAKKQQIPSELVTASGSGLDPHLSPQGALVQIERISKARNIPADKIKQLVDKQTETPLLGMFGTSRVNILQLNIELDKLK